MKKIIVLIVAMNMVFVFAGCGATDTAEPSTDTAQQAQEIQSKTKTSTRPQTSIDENTAADVDLTAMSTTMVYSEVFDMVTYPDQYDGKIVKMKGIAVSYYDENTEETYHACIVQDATACCSQGLEYILADSGAYPEDEEEITVLGVFQECVVGDSFAYGQIINARLL